MQRKEHHIIVLSGPIGVGKTTLAKVLVERLAAVYVSTSALIMERVPNLLSDRRALQRAGNQLDIDTHFSWIAEEVSNLENEHSGRTLIIDSVRVPDQVLALRTITPAAVIHIHLHASYDHVVHRHRLRSRPIDAGLHYHEIQSDLNESWQLQLADVCDLFLDSEDVSLEALTAQVISFVGQPVF